MQNPGLMRSPGLNNVLFISIEMPGRAFTPAALPTDQLRTIVESCREAEETLANSHGDAFMLWGRANREGNQALSDQLEKECKSLRRKQTMNVNKMYKAQNELCRRDIQSLRGLI